MNELAALANQVRAVQENPQALVELFAPYLLKPGSIIAVLSFVSVIVPFTEELLKPIGVWLFAGKLESPAQGFALGALSGEALGGIKAKLVALLCPQFTFGVGQILNQGNVRRADIGTATARNTV